MCFSLIIKHLNKECIGEKATSFVQGEIKHDWSIVILPVGNMHADKRSTVYDLPRFKQ